MMKVYCPDHCPPLIMKGPLEDNHHCNYVAAAHTACTNNNNNIPTTTVPSLPAAVVAATASLPALFPILLLSIVLLPPSLPTL